jgi:outer membrane protein TolC
MINRKSLELAKALYANEDVLMRSGKSTLTELRIRQENLLSSQQALLNSKRDLIQAAVNIRFLASNFYSQDGKFLITSITELFNLSELTE